jgi:alkaline phosphatase D
MNNGGKYYTDKITSQKLILDFLDEPAESERRKREGLYTSFEFGDSSVKNKVKLIIFDTRYFRTDPRVEDGGISFSPHTFLFVHLLDQANIFWEKRNGSGWKKN